MKLDRQGREEDSTLAVGRDSVRSKEWGRLDRQRGARQGGTEGQKAAKMVG